MPYLCLGLEPQLNPAWPRNSFRIAPVIHICICTDFCFVRGHVQVRDLAEGAAVSQQLPVVLSAEAYAISAELRPPPPPPPTPSPRGKPGSPRPAASPRGKAPKPQAPTDAARLCAAG